MPRNTHYRYTSLSIQDKVKFLSINYKRYGRLRLGHSGTFQVLEVEDLVLQQWNLRRSVANLDLIYQHPIQQMNATEAEFFDLPSGKFGVQTAEILTYREYLCSKMDLDTRSLPGFAKYVHYLKRHIARDIAEAIADARQGKGDVSEYVKAQRAWCGATRRFELQCTQVGVYRCRGCHEVSVYKSQAFTGLCAACKEHATSLSSGNAAQPVFIYGPDNLATPPPPLPGAASLTDDERAAISPVLPYIRVLKSKTCSRGKSYGHSFISPQNISDIVRALPRLPVEISFAHITDEASSLKWDVNVPRLVHLINVMSQDAVLHSVFTAHGIVLHGAECRSRLQEWQQSTSIVPRVPLSTCCQPDLDTFCAEGYHNTADQELDAEGSELLAPAEFGSDLPVQDEEQATISSYSMFEESIDSQFITDQLTTAINNLDGYSVNVAQISSNVRQSGQVSDHHPDLFNLCFPYLNIGTADFFYSLEGRQVAFKSRYYWLKHILASDSRFCCDKLFAFVCQNWVQRGQVLASAAVYMKRQSVAAQKNLEDIRAEIEQGDFSSLNDIVSFSKSIQGSVPYWKDVRHQVKEFFDWKCLQEGDANKRYFHQNRCGFPDTISTLEVDIDLTEEEIDLVGPEYSIDLVRYAANSEKIWSQQCPEHEEDTAKALEVFSCQMTGLQERLHNFFDLSDWDIHTLFGTLQVRMFDTSLSLTSRALYAVTMSRLQFLRMYSAFDTQGCKSLIEVWSSMMDSYSDEVEMFLKESSHQTFDLDTAAGAYNCHSKSFATLFRERSFQFMSAANPAFFITGSMAEMHWPELWVIMKQYVDLNQDESDTWVAHVKQYGFDKSADKAEALRRYPNISGALFRIRTELLYDIILGPVLGINEKMIRYEFADGRGEIHFHSLNWSEKWPIGVLVEEQNEVELLTFARVWLRLSALHPSHDVNQQRYHEFGNPHGDRRTFAGASHPSKQYFTFLDPDQVHDWDVKMCNANFCHSCVNNSYCLRAIRGKNGPDYTGPGMPGDRCNRCRYDFHSNDWRGKDFLTVDDACVRKADVNSIPEIVMERNSRFLVQHSKFFRRAWKANCDFSVIVDPDPSKIQAYIISYLCKEGVATSEYKYFFKSMVFNDDIADVSQLVKKMMLKILGHRDKSAQEVFFTATGNALYHISAQRGCVINLGELRRAVSKTCFLGQNIVDKYVKSCAGDNGVSLYEFAQNTQEGYVTFSGSRVFCNWPLTEKYCQTTLLVHLPWSSTHNILEATDHAGQYATFRSKFIHDFLFTHQCPRLVYSQVLFAKLVHSIPALRPRNYFSVKDAGKGSVDSFLKAYGNRSLDVDLQHSHASDVQYPKAPPGWDWSSTAFWGDLEDVDIESALRIARYSTPQDVECPSLRSLCPLSHRTKGNAKQVAALSVLLHHCLERHNNPLATDCLKLILHGAGGTGKSYIIKTFSACVRAITGDPKSILVITPTGASASQVDGETIHRGLGINVNGAPCSADKNAALCSELAGLKVLVIDEMSMLDSGMLSTVNKRLKTLLRPPARVNCEWQSLWCVLLAGDFMQLPPVKGVSLYANQDSSSENVREGQVLYRQFDNCFILSKSERLAEEGGSLETILQNVREGTNLEDTLTLLNSRTITLLPAEEQADFDFKTAPHFVAYNVERIQRNIEHLSHVEGPVISVPSADHGNKRHCNAFDSSTHFCGLQSTLWLGRGVKVIMCLNICTKLKLTKSCTGTVAAVYFKPGSQPPSLPTLILVTLDTDVVDKLQHCLSPLPHHKNTLPFIPHKVGCEHGCCYREQYPFEMCAALTFHKSQGGTVSTPTIIHLSTKAEQQWPGITYTALSRFTSITCFCLPAPVTGDLLAANRKNLYTSGRREALNRLQRLEEQTIQRFAQVTAVQSYTNAMSLVLSIEQFRDGSADIDLT